MRDLQTCSINAGQPPPNVQGCVRGGVAHILKSPHLEKIPGNIVVMTRIFSSKRIFVFGISSSRLFAQVRAQWCYYPGGEDRALQQIPCDPYAYTTLCCPLGWTCFSNNLCVVTDETAVGSAYPVGTALRGTCTNPSWNDTACGGFCLGMYSQLQMPVQLSL